MRLFLHRRPVRVAGLALAAFGLVSVVVVPSLKAKDAKPAEGGMSIEDIMKKGFKGKPPLVKRVADGAGSKEDVDTLVDLSKALAAAKPPKGDAKSWADKTAALLAAAQGVQSGDKTAGAALTKASNCKACHTVHKED